MQLVGVACTSSLQVRNESLRYFAEAWNAIIQDLRASDLLSNHEQSLLLFNSWEGTGFSRCAYFPTFITAGKLSEVFHLVRGRVDLVQNVRFAFGWGGMGLGGDRSLL